MRRIRTMGLCLVAVSTIGAMGAAGASGTPYGVLAWGANGSGQLGDNSTISSDVPVAVSLPSGVTATQVAGGYGDSLALLSNGTVLDWGENTSGQLGNGSITNSHVPVAVCNVGATPPCSAGNGNLLTGVTAIAAGFDHSLALLKSGTVVAWGANFAGQLGDGTVSGSDIPVAVTGLSGVAAIAGGFDHSLALLKSGMVMSWGENGSGELGNGSFTNSTVPVAVSLPSGDEATAVSGGYEDSLALLRNGRIMSWGEQNIYGWLGNGGGNNSDVPVAVDLPSGDRATAVYAGWDHLGALLEDGTVMDWGDDQQAELGSGVISASSPVPVPVCAVTATAPCSAANGNLLTGVTSISAGSDHTVAVLSDGTAVAWGLNEEGQLGDGMTTGPETCPPFGHGCSSKPVAVSGLSGVAAVAAGAEHSLAIASPATITVSPGSSTNPVGTNHTVSATVTEGGAPVAGKTVMFKVTTGPNAGMTGSAVTDANGRATFSYHDSGGAGNDLIEAHFTDGEGTQRNATATKAWVFPRFWTDSGETTPLRSVAGVPKNQPDALEFVNNGPVEFALSIESEMPDIICEMEFGTTVLLNNGEQEPKLALPFGVAEGGSCGQEKVEEGGEEVPPPNSVPTYFDTRANGSVPATITVAGAGPTYTATVRKLKLSQNIAGKFCTANLEGIRGTLSNVTTGFVEESPPNLNLQFTGVVVPVTCTGTKQHISAALTANFFLETPSTDTDTAFVG